MSRKVRIKYHYLYKTTNVINGNYYIGVHSTYNLKDDYLGSGTKLWNAIYKYGKENFKREILEFFETSEQKFLREKELVNEQLLQDPLCMNLKPGGDGGFTNKEHQLKCSAAGGKACSSRLKNDEELRKKFADNYGKIGREKLKEVSFDWTGKHRSEETKKKIGAKNSVHQSGEKNSQYGTCWITNGVENKKIKECELNAFLKLDWKRGRCNVFNNEAKQRISEKSSNQRGEKNSGFGKTWMYKDSVRKRVSKELVPTFLNDGWMTGWFKNI